MKPRKLSVIVVAIALTLAIATGAYLWVKQPFTIDFSDSNQAHNDARLAFLADLPQKSCLRAEDIKPVAIARGWAISDPKEHGFCVKPDTIVSWLGVSIEPPLAFSSDDENAEVFGFDAAGCAVDWSYGAGPGSTCPDS